MTGSSPSYPRGRGVLASLLGCILLAGCGEGDAGGNAIEVDVTDSGGETVDLDAYAEQRLNGGAVTLIDAAIPDGVLMPGPHVGPTLGEIQEAEKAKAREAAAKARGDGGVDTSAADDSDTVAPEAPVLEVDPAVTQ